MVAVDRDVDALRQLAAEAPGLTVIEADLEAAPWPLGDRTFAAVVVTNYLHRPLLRHLADAVAPGGVLLYQTFRRGHERFVC